MTKNNLKKIDIKAQHLTSLFRQPFLSTFFINFDRLPLSEDFLSQTEKILNNYEKSEIDWQLEESLRLRNNILTSFAVSKAENSALSLAEATEVYKLINDKPDNEIYTLIKRKLKTQEKLTRQDHDRLEFFNITRTFKNFTKSGIKLKNLNLQLILNLHRELTAGLDIFSGQLNNFEVYHSGHFRSDDQTRVAKFKPAPYLEIEEDLKELISWLKKNPSALNIFIFHSTLYALHPFKNGNKRVCRLLEYFLLQDIGYNKKNIYSSTYYYHKHQDQYYKNLIETLYQHNLSYFVSFASEALFFSILGVIAGVLQRKKLEFLEKSDLDKKIIKILKPLVKRREVKFNRFYALTKRKLSRQTFITYLSEAVDIGIVLKRKQGKNVYYSLAGNYPEEELLSQLLKPARARSVIVPQELVTYV